jgi:hypothetical protein
VFIQMFGKVGVATVVSEGLFMFVEPRGKIFFQFGLYMPSCSQGMLVCIPLKRSADLFGGVFGLLGGLLWSLLCGMLFLCLRV